MKEIMKKLYKSSIVILALTISVVGFSGSASASGIKEWQTKIVQLVAKKQVYPRAAMRKELEGHAKVRITIDRTGNILSHVIETPTGLEVFDEEIPKLIGRINPLPEPPAELSDANLSFVLPLSWVIR